MTKIFLAICLALLFLWVGVGHAYNEPWQAIRAKDYPAAEALVRARLQTDPGQEENRFLLARLLAWQTRYDEALAEYEVLLAAHPDHADYLLGQGQILFWQGRFTAALRPVNQAIAGNPDYVALWVLKMKILMAQGESRLAHALEEEAGKRFAGAKLDEIRQVLANGPRPVPQFQGRREVEAGLTYEYLSDDFEQWASSYVLGEWFYKPRATVYGQGRLTSRFGQNDQELTVGTYQPLTSLSTYQLEATISPSHEILAEYSLLAGLSRPIKQEWDVAVTGRHSIYTDSNSTLLSLTGGHYFKGQRLAYTIYLSKVEGASETYGHRLQWTRYYDRRNYIGLYVATGRETENVGEVAGRTRLMTTSVFGYGIGGRHWLQDGPFAITYQLWQHDQGDLYTRWGGALGFRIQF